MEEIRGFFAVAVFLKWFMIVFILNVNLRAIWSMQTPYILKRKIFQCIYYSLKSCITNHHWVQIYFKFYAGLPLQNANWIDFLEPWLGCITDLGFLSWKQTINVFCWEKIACRCLSIQESYRVWSLVFEDGATEWDIEESYMTGHSGLSLSLILNLANWHHQGTLFGVHGWLCSRWRDTNFTIMWP